MNLFTRHLIPVSRNKRVKALFACKLEKEFPSIVQVMPKIVWLQLVTISLGSTLTRFIEKFSSLECHIGKEVYQRILKAAPITFQNTASIL